MSAAYLRVDLRRLDRLRRDTRQARWPTQQRDGAAHAVGNTVYMPADQFDSNGKLTASGLETLGHEVGHVWQNQNGGGDYIGNALSGAQL